MFLDETATSATCRGVEQLLETFADGELEPAQTLAMEAHLEGCARCSEQLVFLQAMQASTRRAVYRDAEPTPDFLARAQQALFEEERRQDTERVTRRWSHGWRGTLSAVAMAAAVLVWLGVRGADESVQRERSGGVSQALVADLSMDGALDRLIDYHSSPPQPQVTETNQLVHFEPNVGVRIRAPRLDEYGAHWEGGSLVPVVDQQAAYLRYRMPGHRVTVYVFDARKVTVYQRLEKRVIGEHPIYVGQWRGYSVAAKENRGVGYAMTADLDDQAMLRLISSIH